MGASMSRLAKRFLPKCGMKILMVGLDASGKTTILYKLRLREIVTTMPTIGFNVETVQYKNTTFIVWDVGGQEKRELRNALLLVLANKQDLPNSLSVEEVADKLGLHTLRQHRWHIQSTSAVTGHGLYEGLDWLTRNFSVKAA